MEGPLTPAFYGAFDPPLPRLVATAWDIGLLAILAILAILPMMPVQATYSTKGQLGGAMRWQPMM